MARNLSVVGSRVRNLMVNGCPVFLQQSGLGIRLPAGLIQERAGFFLVEGKRFVCAWMFRVIEVLVVGAVEEVLTIHDGFVHLFAVEQVRPAPCARAHRRTAGGACSWQIPETRWGCSCRSSASRSSCCRTARRMFRSPRCAPCRPGRHRAARGGNSRRHFPCRRKNGRSGSESFPSARLRGSSRAHQSSRRSILTNRPSLTSPKRYGPETTGKENRILLKS
jgi:hypothetical protein